VGLLVPDENQTTEITNTSEKKKTKSSSMFYKNTMKQRTEEYDGILEFIKEVKKGKLRLQQFPRRKWNQNGKEEKE
jgi:hypothetical protein